MESTGIEIFHPFLYLLYPEEDDSHWHEDDSERWQHCQEQKDGADELAKEIEEVLDIHGEEVVGDVDVLGEAIDDAAERGCVEERHRAASGIPGVDFGRGKMYTSTITRGPHLNV